ncbi:MAG: tetratricopeptide repeat protein [Myxococcaceae bacterium]
MSLVYAVALSLVAANPASALRQALAFEETEPRRALALVDGLVRADPSWVLPRLEAARLRLKAGQELDRAEADLEAARSLSPENPRAQFLFGLLQEERGDHQAACRALELAVLYRRDYDEARFRLGGIYFARGDWLKAELHYRAISKGHPHESVARLQLALALEKQGREVDAEAELQALRAAQPDSALVLRRLADFYERTGRPKLAAAARRALADPPRAKMRDLKRSAR